MTRRPLCWLIPLLAAVLLCLPGSLARAEAPAPAAIEQAPTVEAWHSVRLQGQLAGWSHSREYEQDDQVVTEMDLQLAIGRGDINIELAFRTRFVETLDGKPVEALAVQKFGQMAITRTYRFTEAGIELTIRQGNVERRETHPLPQQPWTTPRQSRLLLAKALAQGDKTLDYRTLDPSTGSTELLDVHIDLLGETAVEVVGKTVPARHLKVLIRNLTGVAQDHYVDAQGGVLRMSMEMPGPMLLELIAADQQIAQGKIDPPDILPTMMVQPDRPIARPRQLRQARYELKAMTAEVEHEVFGPEGPIAVEEAPDKRQDTARALAALPSQGMQRVEAHPEHPLSMIITVDADRQAHEPLTDRRMYLAVTSALNHEDPVVAELARRALAGAANHAPAIDDEAEGDDVPMDAPPDALDPAEDLDAPAPLTAPASPADAMATAQKLRRFVLSYITAKDLSIGGATASEVARTRQGDCTEHAVLLAALLRAADIPSRTVTGLVYVDAFAGARNTFGYHMWTQAYIGSDTDGRWVDLDSAMPDDLCDATHIALQTSAMSDNLTTVDLMQLQALIGQIEIRVLQPD